MKSLLRILTVCIVGYAVVGIDLSHAVRAQNLLQYPIADLGYCRDAKECYLYCEIPANQAACWSYTTYKLKPNVLGVATVSGEEKQQMESKAKQLGIVFPIAELGNCPDPISCKAFCDQPANQQACINFGMKKGLTKPIPPSVPTLVQKQALIQKAKTELGCISMESCRALCEVNQPLCEQFARNNGLSRDTPEEIRKQTILNTARKEMGCASMEECQRTCEADPARCMEFARKNGFDTGQEGESQSQEIQQGVGSISGKIPENRFVPPNQIGTESSRLRKKFPGCETEAQCKALCMQYPEKCPGFPNPGTGENIPGGQGKKEPGRYTTAASVSGMINRPIPLLVPPVPNETQTETTVQDGNQTVPQAPSNIP